MAKSEGKGAVAEVPPSVGRIVFYLDREEKVEADRQGREAEADPAIIRRVNENGTLELVVFAEGGLQFRHGVAGPVRGEANHWSWPPRV